MSETKHTPGPWKVVELRDEYQIEEVADPGTLIGTIWKQSYRKGPDNLANATLSAAAPELLAALEKCALAIDSQLCDYSEPEKMQEAYTEALRLIRLLNGNG